MYYIFFVFLMLWASILGQKLKFYNYHDATQRLVMDNMTWVFRMLSHISQHGRWKLGDMVFFSRPTKINTKPCEEQPMERLIMFHVLYNLLCIMYYILYCDIKFPLIATKKLLRSSIMVVFLEIYRRHALERWTKIIAPNMPNIIKITNYNCATIGFFLKENLNFIPKVGLVRGHWYNCDVFNENKRKHIYITKTECPEWKMFLWKM